jgi:hypothetical protein
VAPVSAGASPDGGLIGEIPSVGAGPQAVSIKTRPAARPNIIRNSLLFTDILPLDLLLV